MIHHLKLIHLKPGLPEERVEEVMVESRIRILKIQDVLSLACGKRIPGKEETPHDLFLALEFENSLKRTAAFDHPLTSSLRLRSSSQTHRRLKCSNLKWIREKTYVFPNDARGG